MTSKESPLVSSLEKALSKPAFQKAIAKALAESLASAFEDIQQDRADLADHMAQAATPSALQTCREAAPPPFNIDDEYREPCVFDLNNGPVLVEVRDSHDRPWQTATLTGVGHPSARYQFSTEDHGGCTLGRWKFARIKRACSDQARQMAQPPEGWRLLGKNEVLRKGDKRFNVHGKAWDLERRHIGDLVSDSFNTRFIRRNTFAIGEQSEARAIPGAPVGWELVGFKQIQDDVKVFDEDGDYWTFSGTNDAGDLTGALMPIFEKIKDSK